MKSASGFTNIMTECPPEDLGPPWQKQLSVADFASRHTQLSLRGKRVLDSLLVLLPPHLKSQPTSQVSLFQPTLLFSICDALQLGHADDIAGQNDPSVLPSVLSKLRDWRLLDPDYRFSPGGVHKLALDLAGITDEPSPSTSSDLHRASHAHLRVKWVSSDWSRDSQDQESPPSAPPSPSSSRSGVLNSPQECADTLRDLNKRRSDAGYEFCRVGRLGTPDSEEASTAVSSRHRSVSGFRSGCSACRQPRLSGPTSTPPSPPKASLPFSDVNQFDMNINTSIQLPRYPVSSSQYAPHKKTKRENHRPSQSMSHGMYVDENEPPFSGSMAVQQGIGISFPRQQTHSPRISNTILSREPFSPTTASVQRRLQPSHLLNQARRGDKNTTSHRSASVDLRLSIACPRPNHGSPNDLHPNAAPTRAQSLSYTPDTSQGVGSVGAGLQELSSNAVGFRSSKRLPSWSRTHPTSSSTPSVEPTGATSPPPAKAGRANPPLLPLGARSRPSRTSMPRSLPSDVKHRDLRPASSKGHKHTSSLVVLPFSPASPLIHARKWL